MTRWDDTGTATTYTILDAAMGSGVLGEEVFGEAYPMDFTRWFIPEPTTELRGTWGSGADPFVSTGYLRSEPYEPIIVYNQSNDGWRIIFYNENWSKCGQLTTDVQRSTISRVPKFRISENGSCDCEFELNALPDYVIQNQLIGIQFGREPDDIYRGRLRYNPDQGTTNAGRYTFKAQGLRAALKDLTVTGPISVPITKDVGEIAHEIFLAEVVQETAIDKSGNLIDQNTGTLVVHDLDFKQSDLLQVYGQLAEMADCAWGVDGQGRIYFYRHDEEIQAVHVVGQSAGLIEFVPEENMDSVENVIHVLREKPEGTGETGYTLGDQRNDPESIAKYGYRFKTDKHKVPGYFENADCATVGAALLEQLKEPQISATAKFAFRTPDQLLARGMHRFIAELEDTRLTLTSCETADNWNTTGGVVASVSSTIIQSGRASIQLTYDAAGIAVFEPDEAPERVTEIQIWFKTNRIGNYLTVGYGDLNWDDYETPFAIDQASTWTPFKWTVKTNPNRKIGKIGFSLLAPAASTKLYIDRIEYVKRDNRHYNLRLNYQDIDATAGIITAQFGPGEYRLEDYMQQALSNAAASTAALEES